MQIATIVGSSNIQAVAWDQGKLYVKFSKTGAVYCFDDVPEDEFTAMASAESVGSYFHASIKHRYNGKPHVSADMFVRGEPHQI